MHYTFGNIDGLIEHMDQLSADKRDKQSNTKSKEDSRVYGTEAAAFEYVAMVLRNSDLIQMIMIPNKEDEIQRAADRLSKAEEVIDNVRHALFDSSNSLAMQQSLLKSIKVEGE